MEHEWHCGDLPYLLIPTLFGKAQCQFRLYKWLNME